MAPSPRTRRLKLTWLLALPFLWFSDPTPASLEGALLFLVPGLALRAVASGHIDKDRVLAVSGPFAFLRHPLYVGSFLCGLGFALAGGRWFFLPLFVGSFALAYVGAVRSEEEALALRFGDEYRSYRAMVPAFLPRLARSGGGGGRRPLPAGIGASGAGEKPPGEGFRIDLFLRNRGWEAAAGVAGGWVLLFVKMAWSG